MQSVRVAQLTSRCFLTPALLFLFLVHHPAAAQWRVLHDFGVQVRIVHFLELPGPLRIGFVGLANGQVWRTADGGATWKQASAPGCTNFITGFTFKDSLTGWFSARALTEDAPGVCYRTTDGGLTWKMLDQTGTRSAIHYHASTRTLFLSTWDAGERGQYSTDDGTTWHEMPNYWMNGFAFLSTDDGMITNTEFTQPANWLVTHDGGRTWQSVPLDAEAYQPVAVPELGEYYAASEEERTILRSADRGHTWTTMYTFSEAPTGDIRANGATLFMQTTGAGMFASTDRGATWNSICGPDGATDARFYNRGDSIYAGDREGRLWMTGSATISTDGSQFAWAIEDTVFPSSDCRQMIRRITLRNNDCITMRFDTIAALNEVPGSTQFGVRLDPAQPVMVPPGGEQVIEIVFDPAVQGSGRARLRMYSKALGLDTSVGLVGTSDFNQAVQAVLPQLSGRPGDIVRVPLLLQFGTGAVGRHATFRLRFNGTVLLPRGSTVFYRDGADGVIEFDEVVPASGRLEFSMDCMVMLGNADRSPLVLEQVMIAAACYGAGDITQGVVTVEGICREGTVRLIDAGFRRALRSVRPNPAGGALTIVVDLSEAGRTSLVLRDELGRIVLPLLEGDVRPGTYEHHADVHNLPAGIYYAVLTTPTWTESVPVVIMK